MTQQQPSDLERRVAFIESKLVEFQRFEYEQGNRDSALIIRIDNVAEEVRIVKQQQGTAFDTAQANHKEASARLDQLEAAIAVLIETAKDHKAAIEAVDHKVDALDHKVDVFAANVDVTMTALAQGQTLLAQGQATILALLQGQQGKPHLND
jgi:methionine synthase I (cobalamin-dependent)